MKERKRVSAEDVRNNARNSGSSSNVVGLLALPEGVGFWEPEKSGKYALDFLPYEVKIDNHPDKIEKGCLWWKFPFAVHKNVGVNKEMVLCPRTKGQHCPICNQKDRLATDWDKNQLVIRAIKPQRWWAYKIKNLKDPEKIDVFAISEGKFHDYQGGGLNKEIEEGDEKNLLFYELVKGWGRTVTVRFSEETYEKSTFFKASRFDFAPRPDMEDEADEIIDALCLDDIFRNTLPYDKLEALFLDAPNGQAAVTAGGGTPATPKQEPRKRGEDAKDEDDEDDGGEAPDFKPGDRVQADEGGEPGTVTRVKGNTVKWTTDGGKAMTSEADDLHLFKGKSPSLDGGNTKAPTWKLGDRVSFDKDGKPFTGAIVEIDGEDCTVENDEGDEEDAALDDLQAAPAEAPTKEKKGGKGKETAPPAPDPSLGVSTIAAGDYVKDEDGVVGKVVKVKGTDVTYQDAKGTKFTEDRDDLEKVPAPVAGKEAPALATAELKPGDKVEWDDGMEEGEVVKVKDGKAKVKGDDGTVTLPVAQLTKK